LIGSIMAERFVYLPSVGLAGCIVIAVYAVGKQRPETLRLAGPAAVLICLTLAARA
jgi:hypothetical protein